MLAAGVYNNYTEPVRTLPFSPFGSPVMDKRTFVFIASNKLIFDLAASFLAL
ncbi:hypothetical protein X975_23638, partial [Stegodyphus mimosarum]